MKDQILGSLGLLAVFAILCIVIVYVPDCNPPPNCPNGSVSVHYGNNGAWACVPGVAK